MKTQATCHAQIEVWDSSGGYPNRIRRRCTRRVTYGGRFCYMHTPPDSSVEAWRRHALSLSKQIREKEQKAQPGHYEPGGRRLREHEYGFKRGWFNWRDRLLDATYWWEVDAGHLDGRWEDSCRTLKDEVAVLAAIGFHEIEIVEREK